jgi:dipeptidyl aminopeptidase/acylaminoacyl peptidase
MPEVQEVFRMATQKVRPDPGALERQNRNQRRRHTRERAGGYVLLAVLVIAALVIGFLALRPRQQRPAGQGEKDAEAVPSSTHPFFLDLQTREDEPAIHPGETTRLPQNLRGGYSYVASPDGTRVAFSPSVYECDQGGITIANVDGTEVRTLPRPEGFADCAPRWSPDGSMLLFQRRAANSLDVGNLFVHDLSTGGRTQITDLDLTEASWWFMFPSFSPDGQDVIFHLPRTSSETTTWDVWSVPITGGDPTLVLRNAAFPMLNPALGPEGEEIQFVLPGDDDFAGQSLMTGRPIPSSDIRSELVDANFSIWWPIVSPDGGRIAYQDGGSIYVFDFFTREASKVATGSTAEWLDNDTLIVAP